MTSAAALRIYFWLERSHGMNETRADGDFALIISTTDGLLIYPS
jgi:hypothetical protein